MKHVDELAQIIRTVGGKHDLGAGALAERLIEAGVTAPTEAKQLRDTLNSIEWSATTEGAPYGSMYHNTPGPKIPTCPVCRGIHPEKGAREFTATALGHRPTCIFAKKDEE